MASADRLLYLGHQFGKRLRDALIQRYKRLPSAAFVAIHFNRKLGNSKPVSNESVRRWMRGETMPRHEHMAVLVEWLNIDTCRYFNSLITQSQPPLSDAQKSSDIAAEVLKLAQLLCDLPPNIRKELTQNIPIAAIL
jgi:hypothetical protein